MFSSKFYTLAALCRQSHKIRFFKNKFNQLALIHKTSLTFGHIEIKMPSLSPTMTEGTIVKWLKKEGDPISPGDVLCEIQTDKAVVGFEVEEEGVLLKIIKPDDSQNVKLGDVIAIISGEGDSGDTSAIGVSADMEKKNSITHVSHKDSSKLLGPAVRKLLAEYNVDFSAIQSSGPHNVVLKGDVLNFIKKENLKPQVPSEQLIETKPVQISEGKVLPSGVSSSVSFIDLPLSSMRKTIARRLTESKSTIPHAYISTDCIIDNLLNLRKKLKTDGINVSVNDFIVKSVAIVLNECPKMNVINSNGKGLISPSVDISVAVATENGLITPIVKNADNLSILEISETIKTLAVKARQGKLRPEEFQGGSFTISNLGMFGISEFSAVINPPQGAILAVGSSFFSFVDHPVQKVRITLSFDCSVIDEEIAAEFMQKLKILLGDPSFLLL